jgi:predicted O-methyltransferase YrrM
MVETGVFDGESSAVILQAMSDNGEGKLVSIDLPAVETIHNSTEHMRETMLPPGCSPGWAIPDFLRARHRLELGDSREILPRILGEFGAIDIFFHDSLHTFDHMSFEYVAAWRALRAGGFLLSDDILWNSAFHTFCRGIGTPLVRIGGFGAAKK